MSYVILQLSRKQIIQLVLGQQSVVQLSQDVMCLGLNYHGSHMQLKENGVFGGAGGGVQGQMCDSA